MVLGFLRRRKGKPDRTGQGVDTPSSGGLTGSINGPQGEETEEGYIPDPRELDAAELLPVYALGAKEALRTVNEEEYGWVLLNTQSWKPCRAQGIRGRKLAKPIRLPNLYEYRWMVWFRGKVYLFDGFTYALLYNSDCERTAAEIVGLVLDAFFKGYPESDPDRKAWESGETNDTIMDYLAGAYLQLALLKHYGFIS